MTAPAESSAAAAPSTAPTGADGGAPSPADAKKTYTARLYGFLGGLWNERCGDGRPHAFDGVVTVSGTSITAVSAGGPQEWIGKKIPAPPEASSDLVAVDLRVKMKCAEP